MTDIYENVYILADNIDINVFCCKDSQQFCVPLKTGKNQYMQHWDLQQIELKSVDTSLTHIAYYFFHKCNSLVSLDVSLLSNIERIDLSFFLEGCTALKTLTLWDQDPSTITIEDTYSFFNNTPNLGTIYVPSQYVDYYNNNEPWNVKQGKYVAKQ